MGIRSLSSASISTGTKRSKFWDQSTTLIPPTGYFSIASAIITTGGASSITFSGINPNFTHLELRWVAANNRTTESMDDIAMQFNGDTTSGNYISQRYYSKASTVSTDSVNGYGCIFGWCAAGGRINSNTFGMGIATIPNYTSSNKKVVTAFSGMDNASITTGQAGGNQSFAGYWSGTSPINEIKIYGINGNFEQDSKFYLYGIK
jgi:hypothetical protein